MKKFIYKSETPCHTSISINGKETEISLFEGKEYELPAKDPRVLSLIARGLLVKTESNNTKILNEK